MKRSTKTCHCGKPSLPGLRKGVALCRYHFNEKIYGKEWADKVEKIDRPSQELTGDLLMTALERADVAADEELRIEFSGDDNTPQELVGIERRESEGIRYVCVMVRNT